MKIINKPKKRTSDLALFPILKIYKKNGAAMTEEKIIICFRCKIKMNKTELKDVYKCPACALIEEKEQEK